MVEGDIFEELEDNRQDWKVKHSMTEIMMVVMCGVSVGEMSIYGIRKFAQIKEKWLKEATNLEFPNGLPSYDTIRRTLGSLRPKSFQAVFIRWIEAVLGKPVGSYVSFDGKSQKEFAAKVARKNGLRSGFTLWTLTSGGSPTGSNGRGLPGRSGATG